VTSGPLVFAPTHEAPGGGVTGTRLAIANWPTGAASSGFVAPLHVHRSDDEAWHVIEGALRFRLGDDTDDLIAPAGSTVLVPAGVPHTFGNAGPGPSRYLIIMSTRLQEFIAKLHEVGAEDHAAIYEQYDSELLE
jgi:mannose-6-phosphate isomerase-like protein (cupin superfamily)